MNVRDFGAAGDGEHNDRVAVIRALYRQFVPSPWFVRKVPRHDPAKGVTLYFPPGRYRVAASLSDVLCSEHLTVVGAGQDRITLVFDQTTRATQPPMPPFMSGFARLEPGGSPGRRSSDVTISGLTMTTWLGPEPPVSRTKGAAALSLGWCQGLRVEDVRVAGCANTGMYVYDCLDVTIERCELHHINLDAVHVARSAGVTIRDCEVRDTGDDGIAVSGSEYELSRDVAITGNRLSRCGSNGISIFGADRVAVTGNVVDGTYMCGITVRTAPRCGSTRNVLIQGNEVDGAGLYPGEDVPPEAPLWGGGAPYGIAVANDSGPGPGHPGFIDVTLGPVDIRDNHLGACRNSFVALQRATAVTVAGNTFAGPLVSSSGPYDRGEGDDHLGDSGVCPPVAPDPDLAPGTEPVPVRVHASPGTAVDVSPAKPPASSTANGS